MSLFGIIRPIDNLRADFGLDFISTLAPVADAMLHPLTNLSGLDYAEPVVRNVTTRGTIGRCTKEWLMANTLAAVREVDAS
ncbi:Uncharacterized protein HZ326_30270 [Fusarium oxysporum f. sp. albedinis]|nr:Uncharacterized protein HZ326_30270 [Fusarium oxysporum f. sp. albedinis]